MQNSKAVAAQLEQFRAIQSLDVPVLNNLKRKRTDSPELRSPLPAQPLRRPRADSAVTDKASSADARLPATSGPEQVSAAASGAIDIEQDSLPASKDQASMSHFAHWNAHSEGRHGGSFPQYEQPRRISKIVDGVVMMDESTSEDVHGLKPLQQVIENEFNMQILNKHNELRLIETELAKCQIALEQLRRCEMRPYPGSQHLSSAVSQGTGPMIIPPPGYTRPSHPAPYGVTDGPYARHYQRWLLQDPQFDSMPESSLPMRMVGDPAAAPEARPTRTAHSARKSIQKSVTMPSRSSDAMKSLPNYPVPSKDKACYLKRSTDGQWVKLICNNCLRGNFSSIQGFLNHCRIAHKVDYKSHDSAAIDCGRLLDEQEVANIPPEAHAAAAVHKPSASRSSSTTTTPFKAHTSVHPLNTADAATFINSFSKKPAQRRPSIARKPVPAAVLKPNASALNGAAASFTPSAQAPRLSAHFAKHNLGGNLEQAITHARQKVELPLDEALSPDDFDLASPSIPAPKIHGPSGARTVPGMSRAGSLAPPGNAASRPPSRKGYREAPRAPILSSQSLLEHANFALPRQGYNMTPLESPHDRSSNFSPHTAESNPGLVSDHEDDDHGSASEDEVPQRTIAHSLGMSRGGCAENMDVDVRVDEDVDEGVIIRRNSMLVVDERGLRTAGSPSRKMSVSK